MPGCGKLMSGNPFVGNITSDKSQLPKGMLSIEVASGMYEPSMPTLLSRCDEMDRSSVGD